MIKPNHSNHRKKKTNFYLILWIRLTCKFVIPDIKRKNKIIFFFVKYWPSSRDFNKLVIKAKNAC
jgi:hypothetical protein